MKHNNKKGFTIVELVIVIAIIAILAAVLIPTFSSLIKRANVSKDNQLVRNLNTALVADAAVNGKHETMSSALKAAEDAGYIVERINASAKGNEILWDSVNDVFCYRDGETVDDIKYIPEAPKKKDVEPYQYWVISDTLNPTYSTYYTGSETEVTVSTGFDASDKVLASITSITYENTTSAEKDVVIRTNGGYLTINAAADTVKHYGEAEILDIQAINTASYHEFGKAGLARLKQGHFVVEAEGVVNVLYATGPKSGDTRVVVDNNNGTIGKAYATVTETANIYNGAAQEGQSGNVTLEKYDAVITEAVVTAMNSESIVEVLASEDSSVAAVKETIEAAVESSAFLGEGTEANPYIISSVNDLVKLSQKVAGGNSYEGEWFALSKNIDMKDVLWGVATETETINCIGTQAHPFKGNFDGKGHTVMNLTNGYRATAASYTSPTSQSTGYYFALFGYVSGGTQENPLEIKNLTVDLDANVPGGSACAGLISSVSGTSYINLTKVTVTGDLIAKEKAGGFIYAFPGDSTITLTDCINLANVSAKERVSGFVSFPQSTSTIHYVNCQNLGNITILKEGDVYGSTTKHGVAAGFTAHINSATITYDNKCSNSGIIDAPLAADFHTYASVLKFNNGVWSKGDNFHYEYAIMMKGIIKTESSASFASKFEEIECAQHGLDGLYYDSTNTYVVEINRPELNGSKRVVCKYTLEEWNDIDITKYGLINDDQVTTTITLMSDLNWITDYQVGTSRTIIVDLNNHTLTAVSSIMHGAGSGTKITFKNGNINAEGISLIGNYYSEVNFENVTGSYIDQ